jgi:carboxypeptidase C (cathepsin A)
VYVAAEHGPFRINSRLTLEPANYSWEVNHNMIYIDQPMNTGFSFSPVSGRLAHLVEFVQYALVQAEHTEN